MLLRSIFLVGVLLFLQLLYNSSRLHAQSNVDSLEHQMEIAQGNDQLRIMLELGKIYAAQDPDRGLELGLKAAFLAKRSSNPELEGHALLLMGQSSLSLNEQENALRYYNRASNHFEKINGRQGQLAALEGIANVYSLARNFELALRYLERAQALARSINREDIQVRLHRKVGDIALEVRDYSQAYREYTQVLTILEREEVLSDEELALKATLHRQIGFIYRNLGELDESLNAFRQANRINQLLGRQPAAFDDFREIAQNYFFMQRFDSALVYYNRVLSYHQLRNDSLGMVDLMQCLGEVFLEQNRYSQAMTSFNQSLRFAEQIGDLQGQIAALVSISRCYYALDDYTLSSEYLNQALDIAKSDELSETAADVYLYLSQVNEAQGRYMQALEFYKLWSEIRDSIYSQESGQQMAKMQILYEIAQKERENEILRQNSEIQDLLLTKTRYQGFVFIALAISFFALLILLIFLYRGKQREIVKQKEAEQRIKELNKTLEKRMISEIKKQEKQQLLLAQKSKLESLGTLAAGIAHEINQPLGGISMGLDNILIKASENKVSQTYIKEKVNLLFDNVERIKRIIDHVRSFSRTQKPASMERVDLNDVVNNTMLMVKTQFENHDIDVRINLMADKEYVIADKYKLEQVLLNLLSNARHALEEKARNAAQFSYDKRIEISTYHDEKNVYLSVWDNGVGIKTPNREKIFDPFFTTKKQDQGTGLGLAISYGFIVDIMGDIRVDSTEGEFTKFELVIPK